MNVSAQAWSRRKFIKGISSAGALMAINPLLSWKVDEVDPRVAKIAAATIGIDTHNHIDVPLDAAEMPGPDLDVSGELKKSGLSAIVMTFATDYKRNIQPGEAYRRFLNGLAGMDNVLTKNKITRALHLPDIKTAHQQHQPIVIQSVEGCHFLEGKAERVEIAYKRGLRHLGLLHDSDAAIPLGDVYTNPAQFGGLTDFGKEVIKECNRLGLLIDLAHASNETINAALKITNKPVLISHTGLDTRLGKNERMAGMMKPRLISKEQAKIVADAGGAIGVWTHLADTPIEYAENIRAMAEITGVDHVCIGTDTKLTGSYRSPADFGGPKGEGPKGDPPKGPGGPGPANGKRGGDKTNETWADQTTGFYYAVVDAMLKTGFTEAEIGKIGGGNYCRLFDAATSGH